MVNTNFHVFISDKIVQPVLLAHRPNLDTSQNASIKVLPIVTSELTIFASKIVS